MASQFWKPLLSNRCSLDWCTCDDSSYSCMILWSTWTGIWSYTIHLHIRIALGLEIRILFCPRINASWPNSHIASCIHMVSGQVLMFISFYLKGYLYLYLNTLKKIIIILIIVNDSQQFHPYQFSFIFASDCSFCSFINFFAGFTFVTCPYPIVLNYYQKSYFPSSLKVNRPKFAINSYF